MKKFGLGGRKAAKEASYGPEKTQSNKENPYAAMGASGRDPYAPKSSAPPAYDGGMSDFRRDKSPVPPGGYGGQPYGGPPQSTSRFGTSGINESGSRYGNSGPNYGEQGGYGSNRYGDDQPSGYGSNRFGTSGVQESQQPKRAGGYGGMGMSNEETEAAQGALFGGAAQRYQTKSAPPTNAADDNNASNAYGNQPGGYGSTSGGYGQDGDNQGYGAYGDRELTAEEQEEEDIQATVWYLVAALALQWLLMPV